MTGTGLGCQAPGQLAHCLSLGFTLDQGIIILDTDGRHKSNSSLGHKLGPGSLPLPLSPSEVEGVEGRKAPIVFLGGLLGHPPLPASMVPNPQLSFSPKGFPEVCSPNPDSVLLGAGWVRKGASGLPAGPPALHTFPRGEPYLCPTPQPIALIHPHLPFQSPLPLKVLV